jgi:hypothetical protein
LNIENDGFIKKENNPVLIGTASNINDRGVIKIDYDENLFKYDGRKP